MVTQSVGVFLVLTGMLDGLRWFLLELEIHFIYEHHS